MLSPGWLRWGIVIGVLVCTACISEKMQAPSPVKMTWAGKALEAVDSVPSRLAYWPSAGPFEWRFVTSSEPKVEIAVIPFEKPWHARLAWQSLPGERGENGDWVRSGGGYALVAGKSLLWVQAQGSALMRAQDLAQLEVKGWQWGEEPAFAQLFLQRHRLMGSGCVMDDSFLGLDWRGPLYAMRYAYLGDTVQVIVATTQDSTFYEKNEVKGQALPFLSVGQNQGEARLLMPGGKVWNGHWGEKGLVLLEGCFALETCKKWAQDQYQALELFKSDGFF